MENPLKIYPKIGEGFYIKKSVFLLCCYPLTLKNVVFVRRGIKITCSRFPSYLSEITSIKSTPKVTQIDTRIPHKMILKETQKQASIFITCLTILGLPKWSQNRPMSQPIIQIRELFWGWPQGSPKAPHELHLGQFLTNC